MIQTNTVRFWYCDQEGSECLIEALVQRIEPEAPETSAPPEYDVEIIYAETIDGQPVEYGDLQRNLKEIEYFAAQAITAPQLPRFFSYELQEAHAFMDRINSQLADEEWHFAHAEASLKATERLQREGIYKLKRLTDIFNQKL